MIRNPIFTFDNILSTGVDKIPLNTVVVINDVSGVVKRIHVHDLTGITSASTIEDLLDGTVGDYTESEERGGLLWYQPASYLAGDTVTINNELFVCLTDHLSATGDVPTGDPSQPLQTNWSASIGSVERGGVAFDILTEYSKGDIVVDLSDFSTYKSIINSNTGNTPSSASSGWIKLIDPELGGLVYDATLNYAIGTVVTEANTAYIAIVDTALNQPPSTHPGKYIEIGGTERGGVFYQASTNYKIGDIITADTGTNIDVYRCITAYTSVATGLPADFLAEVANWTKVTGAVGSLLKTEYRFDTKTTGTPVGGKAQINNLDPALATEVHINKTDMNGISREYGLMLLSAGDFVSYLDQNTYKAYTYEITSDVTDNGSWVSLEATYHNGSGTFNDSEDIFLEMLFVYNEATQTPEVGGVNWYVGANYTAGDIVMSDAAGPGMWKQYYCISAHTSSTVPKDDAANWKEVTASANEKGGIAWDTANNYIIGDTVAFNQKLYIANKAIPTLAGDPETDTTDWDLVTTEPIPERGGVSWATAINYLVGDIVMSDHEGPGVWKQYNCIVSHTSVDATADAANWQVSTSSERGGIAWNTTDDYITGDIVYDTINDTPYVAIVTPVTDHVLIPSLNLTEWKAITGTSGSMLTADYRFSTLTAGDPGSGSASCNNADNTLADVLFISDLDEDNIDRTYGLENLSLGDYVNYRDKGNDPDTYIYRVTGDSIDQGTYFEVPVVHHTSVGAGGLADNERMNVEVLFLSQAIPERGGIAWDAATTYSKGDIIVNLSDFSTYKCNINGNIGNVPSSPLSGWDPMIDPELGGLVYDPTLNYASGTVITENDITYVALVDLALNQPPSTHPGKYKVVGEEQGGIAYNPTVQYELGDIVSIDGVIYVIGEDPTNVGNPPPIGTLPGDPEWSAEPLDAERGGIFYKGDTDYKVGDLITATFDDGTTIITDIYRCILAYTSAAGGTPADFVLEVTNWDRNTITEEGGLLWRTGHFFDTGTTASLGGFLYVCIRPHTSDLGDNLNGDPTQPTQTGWVSGSTAEYGGREFRINVPYIKGDIVTDPNTGNIYIAKQDIIDKLNIPSINTTEWELSVPFVERGGLFYAPIIGYQVGDIITASDGLETKIYRCILAYTSAPGGNPTDFLNEKSNWVSANNPHGYMQETALSVYTPDELEKDFFDYTLNQDASIAAMINPEPGNTGTIVIRQDSVGAWVVNWDPNYIFPSGTPVIGATPFDGSLFNYYVLTPVEILVEFVLSFNIIVNAPIAILDFNATDIEVGQITMTWTETAGETYDLYDSVGLVAININSGHVFIKTGTSNYRVLAKTGIGSLASNVDSGTGVAALPVALTDFNATDIEINQIIFTWTETIGETYNLYDSTGLVTSDINTGYILTITGTDDYYVKVVTGSGTLDSNTDSGTGVAGTPVTITDFNATDTQYDQITMTWTESAGETYDLYDGLGLVKADVRSGHILVIQGTEDYYVTSELSGTTVDSNADQGTGLFTVVAILDFNATDGENKYVTVTFTEQ